MLDISEYAKKGYDIVPLWAKEKYAAVESGQDLDTLLINTTNESRLAIIQKKNFNIGVLLKDLCVLDYDKQTGLEDFIRQYGIDLSYPGIVKTHDGYHVWFRCSSTFDQFFCKDGVELKTKLYVPVPGSIHPEGTPYTYLNGSIPEKASLHEFTNEYYNSLLLIRKPTQTVFSDDVSDGGRNVELAKLAGLLIGKDININIVRQMVGDHNKLHMKPPKSDKEVNTIVDSIFKTAKRNANGTVTLQEEQVVRAFKLTNLRDLKTKYGNTETSWLIPGYVPMSSCGLLLSRPEMGKTWFLLELALSISLGEVFLGEYQPTQVGKVWYIQQEDNYSDLLKRLMQLLHCKTTYDETSRTLQEPGDSFPLEFYTEKDFHFDNEDIIESFTNLVLEEKPKLVLIDPMYTIGNTSDFFASTAQSMGLFKKLRDQVGTSFLVAHHQTGESSKEMNPSVRERDTAWGSVFLKAWQEFGIQLSYKEGKKILSRNFKTTGKPDIVEFLLEFTSDDSECNLRTKPYTSDAIGTEDEDKINYGVIAQSIKNGKIATLQDLIDNFGVENTTKAKRILDKLGATKKEGQKLYTIEGH